MRLKRRPGCFGLYGCDFMIDEQMKVWLIEINVNPSLTTNTKTLLQAIPPVVHEAIRTSLPRREREREKDLLCVSVVSLECFEKVRHHESIFPLKSVEHFQCLYNEYEQKGSLLYQEEQQRRRRRRRSVSPSSPVRCSLPILVPRSSSTKRSSRPFTLLTDLREEEKRTSHSPTHRTATIYSLAHQDHLLFNGHQYPPPNTSLPPSSRQFYLLLSFSRHLPFL